MAEYEAQLKSPNGRVMVKVSAGDVPELFEKMAIVQEVIDADDKCGVCGSTRVKMRVRRQAKFKFYELHCDGCQADLTFGIRKDDHVMYPHRFDEKAKLPLPHRGWKVYQAGAARAGGQPLTPETETTSHAPGYGGPANHPMPPGASPSARSTGRR